MYLCSALHAVAKQNKLKIDSAKLFELAKSTKKDVIGNCILTVLIDCSINKEWYSMYYNMIPRIKLNTFEYGEVLIVISLCLN